MNGKPAIGPVPLLEELLGTSADALGADRVAYRNHAHRVFHFARALGAGGPDDERKLAIGCHFHDLGIWTDRTFDYLEPSVALAAAYLDEQGLSDWASEISAMIRQHHKVTSARASGSLVETFRRADWVDVSLGARRFGLGPAFLREVRRAFPNRGFHRRLVELTLERVRSHPLDPLPMFRW